ncbi:MAG: 3'-5' exonuclease, partial [Myxococcales bacterium]
ALTFTNKAAGEMRERVASSLHAQGAGAKARSLTISTFHAFGLSVLQRERAALGGVFTIFDQGDQIGAVKEILRSVTRGKTWDASAILARISNAKNAFLEPGALPDKDEYDEIAKIVYPKYQRALRQFCAYDFDDLVCEVARLWQSRPDILQRWQDRFHFLLVDEYQDTNRAQLVLLRLLAERHKNVCVVGDDDQSIYAWRGADVRNILEFEEHFPGATVVKLEQNYRSTAPILAVANAVIAKRADAKYKKTLFTSIKGGESVDLVVASSPEQEARFVARELRRLVREEGRKLDSLAVLYRSNGQAKQLEESLREYGVVYRMFGGQQFFERKEVKDLLGYMKIALNPSDEISLRRIMNYPARGIGDTSVERLALHALARGWSLWQAVERVDALDDIPSAAREGCKALERIVNDTRGSIFGTKQRGSEVARGLAERIGLRNDIDVSSPSKDSAARRWGNVESIVQAFARRELREGGKTGTVPQGNEGLASYLHALTLSYSDEADEGPGGAVTLSTLHGAKGLEFDVVFLVGCEEGLLPHTRTLETRATDAAPQDIEEERRLFYVGVTRARQKLILSRARARVSRGKPSLRTPSRFLADIPSELVVERQVQDEALSRGDMVAHANQLLAALDALE